MNHTNDFFGVKCKTFINERERKKKKKEYQGRRRIRRNLFQYNFWMKKLEAKKREYDCLSIFILFS